MKRSGNRAPLPNSPKSPVSTGSGVVDVLRHRPRRAEAQQDRVDGAADASAVGDAGAVRDVAVAVAESGCGAGVAARAAVGAGGGAGAGGRSSLAARTARDAGLRVRSHEP